LVTTLENYFKLAGNEELLTREEEVELAQRIEQGDKQAKDKLAKRNLGLVIGIADNYRKLGVDFLDLIQAGNVGLMKAIKKFDWRKGYKFSTYATWWVRQAVLREIQNHGRTIRIPAHIQYKEKAIREAKEKLKSKGEEVTIEKLSEMTDLPEEKIEFVKKKYQRAQSLDKPTKRDSEALSKLLYVPADRKDLGAETEEELREILYKIMEKCLSDRKKQILKLRFGIEIHEEMTLEAVGDVFDLSRERIRQLQKDALNSIRFYLKDHPEEIPKSVRR